MMKIFVNFLKSNRIIQNLKDTYNLNYQNSERDDFIDETLEILLKSEDKKHFGQNNNQIESKNIDIIGDLYESKISYTRKKRFGEFYTPIHIVKDILIATGYTAEKALEHKKIIDLSCGCGSFLIEIIRIIVRYYLQKFNLKKVSDISFNQAKIIIREIEESVYGLDINPIACILCCINIYFSIFELIKIIKKNDIGYKIPNLKIYNINALEYFNFNKFDYVIGNPPYLFLRDIDSEHKSIIEKGNFKTTNGQYDYYQIFIELGIKVLRENGFLGYIVPDSLLALSSRKSIRKYIYDKTKILALYYIGPGFEDPVVSNVIIVLQKESNKKERIRNIITIGNPFINDGLNLSIRQKTLEKWDYKFLVNLSEIDSTILEHLNSNFPKLEDINKDEKYKIRIFRGVELGKDGKVVYCKRCRKYIPFPKNNYICKNCNSILDFDLAEKIVHSKIPLGLEENYRSFLFSMNRYQVKEYKYINIKKNGINYKNIEDYADRIVIRQLNENNMICATYDKESLTSQSYYNLKIIKSAIPEFNHFYLLGLINSQLLSYYFVKLFGSYKKFFPRILIEKVKSLPIKIPKTSNELLISKQIRVKVEKRLFLNDLSIEDFKKLEDDIDSLVFDLYHISQKNRVNILKFLKNL